MRVRGQRQIPRPLYPGQEHPVLILQVADMKAQPVLKDMKIFAPHRDWIPRPSSP